MFRPKGPPPPTLWLPTSALPTSPAHGFYQPLDRELRQAGVGDTVRQACAPYSAMDATRGGRPAVDPEVYCKMLIVGFFENLASERAIAARCADSFSIREFLHSGLDERTSEHSTLTVIRQRLDPAVYDQAFAVVLRALQRHQLLKGKRLGMDASILEANASLRTLRHRLTGETYHAYITELAAAAGVDPTDAAAVRRGAASTSTAKAGGRATPRGRTRTTPRPRSGARSAGARGSTREHAGARGSTREHAGARGSTREHAGARGSTREHAGARGWSTSPSPWSISTPARSSTSTSGRGMRTTVPTSPRACWRPRRG